MDVPHWGSDPICNGKGGGLAVARFRVTAREGGLAVVFAVWKAKMASRDCKNSAVCGSGVALRPSGRRKIALPIAKCCACHEKWPCPGLIGPLVCAACFSKGSALTRLC